MNGLSLIMKLEAHLKHLKDIMLDGTFRVMTPAEKTEVIQDELNLMLALIRGWKEK